MAFKGMSPSVGAYFAGFRTSGQMAQKARWLLGAGCLVAGAAFADTPDVLVNHDGLFNGVQDTSGPAGGTFTYRVKVKHNAGDDATGVTLTEVLPEGAIYVSRSSTPASISCSPPAGQTVNSGTVLTAANKTFTCDVGALGSADGFKWVDFNVILPTVSATWKATASAALPLPYGTSDGDGGLNNVNLDRNFTANDATDFGVKLTSDAPVGGVNNGDDYNYTIQVNNYGPTALPGGGFARVTFQVPAGAPVTAGAIGGVGWTCTPATGPVAANALITCDFPNPPTGSYGSGQALAPITVPVRSQMGGPIGAAVSVEGFQNASTQMADGQKGNNTDSLIVQSTGADYTDVSLTKSATPTVLDASNSNTVTYTLQARRGDGAVQPEQIVVTDVLPSGVTFLAFGANDARWACNQAAGTITCTWDTNAPYTGGNNTNLPPIAFTATVPAQPSGTTIKNEGTVTVKPGTEPNTANNKGAAIVTFSNRAQLSLNKSAPQRPVKKGELFQYTITITNDGPMPIAAASPITVTDTPSADLKLVSVNAASSAGWACPTAPTGTAGAAVTCENSSALAVGDSIKLVLDAKVDTLIGEYAVFSNSAATPGPVPGRDGIAVSSTANVTVSDQSGDLVVDKAVLSAPASPKSGDAITYRISVTNKAGSTQTAQAIQITDVLKDLVHPNDGGTANYPGGGFISAVPMASFPAGTNAVTCPAPTGTDTSRTRTLTCTVDLLAPGQTVYVDVTIRPRIVTATPLATTAMTYSNSASAFSPYINDPTPADNTDPADIVMTTLVDLTVTKQVSPTTEVAAGQPATYTVTTANVGPSSAQGVTMVDTLPANAIMVGEPTVPSGGICTHSGGAPMNGQQGGTMTCTWATALPTQSQYLVTYRARSVGGNPAVPPAPADTMDNSVVVSTTTEETDYTNNSASATIALKPAELDVQIQMSHSDDGLVLGGTTVYTITIKNDNASSSYATGVKMVDLFPATGSTATFSYQGGLAVTGTNTAKAGYVGAVAGVVSASMCTPPTPNPGATTGQLECVIPLMAPGDTVTIKFTMKAESLPTGAKTGTIFHAATVKPVETEYMPGYDALANNSTTDRTSTSAAGAGPVDLGVKKQGPGGIPKAGDAVTYTITVTNYGQNAMSPAGTMTDTLPAGLNFVSAASATAGATCSGTIGSSAPVTCVVPSMAKGASIVYTVETTVSSPFTGSYPLVNKANVKVTGDTNPDNDNDEVKNGNPPPPPSFASIPTLSEWGLILMSGLMGLLALWQMGAMRRRS